MCHLRESFRCRREYSHLVDLRRNRILLPWAYGGEWGGGKMDKGPAVKDGDAALRACLWLSPRAATESGCGDSRHGRTRMVSRWLCCCTALT